MRGLMMDKPLLISSLIRYAAEYHGESEVVSRTVEGPIHRITLAEICQRTQQLANALNALGVGRHDRIGTMAWNGFRHLEAYYAVPGMGAVCHTINPRLFTEQLVYVINHAEDKLLLIDTTFVPLVEQIADQLTSVKGYVLLTDESHMPQTSLPNTHCYETLLKEQPERFDWPTLDEYTACSLCYTSGTTGNPKGVLFSHRSTLIHTWAISTADAMGVSNRDSLLVVVPMFHANGWGTPYAAIMCGAKMVFPGPRMDGESLHELIGTEKVTASAAVPTLWLGLLDYLKASGKRLDGLERVIIGGSAPPLSMIRTLQEEYGVQVIHCWGMTETSPLGTTGVLKASVRQRHAEERYRLQKKQGRGVFGVDLKIVDDDGKRLPRDGVAFGHLMVRGPWIASGYFKDEGGNVLDSEGWFPTGDMATLDPEGHMEITDRAKDIIKSGGEWIGSIELENTVMAHPAVKEAAVIGVHHPKWDERPLLIVVAADGSQPTREELLEFFQSKVAKWWIPDDVVFTDELPHTPTGKVQKAKLRELYADYQLPSAQIDN